jgi:DNA-binding response OmpR family regulator
MNNMKILICDERSDALEFLLEGIANHGYKAGIAKDGPDIINMLADERYDVVLTNGGYQKLDPSQHFEITSSSVFIIGITNTQKRDEKMDSKMDMCLRRPFEASKLWQSIASSGYRT